MKKIKNFFGFIFGRKSGKKKTPKNNAKKNQKKISKQRKTVQKKLVQKAKAREIDQYFGPRLTALNGRPSGEKTYDVCAYVMICVKHNKIALSREERNGFLWLPFIALPLSKTWTDGSEDGANIVLANGNASLYLALKDKTVIKEWHCLQLFRLQLPQTQKFNVRLIYSVKIDANNSSFKCCSDTKQLCWLPVPEVMADRVGPLWGPEVQHYLKLLKEPKSQRIDEYSLDQAFFYVPRDPPRNLEEDLLKSSNYTQKDVERIYMDFVEHCFPAFYMTVPSFCDYMLKYGFEKNDKKLKLLFRSFNFNNSGFLTFSEFLIGLASIEPMAGNGQSRIKLVFKYYDVDGDGVLSTEELTQMVREMDPKKSETEIEKRVKESMKSIGIKTKGIAFEDFFKACGNHKFRGTSQLCRSNRSIASKISRMMALRTVKGVKQIDSGFGFISEMTKYRGICNSCKEKKFEFSLHSIKLNSGGRCVDARPLPEWEQKLISKSSDSLIKSDVSDTRTNSRSSPPSSTSSLNLFNTTREKFSEEVVWNPKSVANYLIEQIRAFNLKKGLHTDNKGLLDAPNEREGFLKKLEKLCSEVEKIVGQEDRCVQVISPAIIIGDIHGNIEDLFTMERVIWRSFPIIASNLVFLGDYVDRGKWGLECAVYILCMKLLAPNKVVALRGNHEVRDLQIHYTYKRECCNKYGDTLGAKIWEVTNRVFDKLPISAVIDDAIYCAHGGIPCTTRLIEKINEVNADLKDPEKESAIAWEILWSDPIGAQQYAETAELLQVRVDSARGFLTNTKRGTAFLFAEEAVNNFLQNNGLTHIVRAHEVPAQGFTFHFGNKCTTVFSSSHYCGNDNSSACVHIDSEKLRIVRLDTKNNAPASD